MATKAASQSKDATIKCVFCAAVVSLAGYAEHVQQNHSTAPGRQGSTQQSGGNKPVPFTGAVSADDFESNKFLRGQDLPPGTTTVEVDVIGFVTIKESRSPLVVSIRETYGRDLFPINKTNIDQLKAFVGSDLVKGIVGKTIKLMTYPTTNPTTDLPAVGLMVVGVE